MGPNEDDTKKGSWISRCDSKVEAIAPWTHKRGRPEKTGQAEFELAIRAAGMAAAMMDSVGLTSNGVPKRMLNCISCVGGVCGTLHINCTPPFPYILCFGSLVPTTTRPRSALCCARSVAPSVFGTECCVVRGAPTLDRVGGLNVTCHAPRCGAVCLLLVREQDTTVILSMVRMLGYACHETVNLRVVGRPMNPTLGCSDIK